VLDCFWCRDDRPVHGVLPRRHVGGLHVHDGELCSWLLDCSQELLVNVAPKHANWDLKRDIQPRLDKLERRTQRAILEIMRQQVVVCPIDYGP
jgi:hypothetical protein